MSGPDLSLSPVLLEAFALAAPLATPRRNAFGTMRHRPGLVVRLRDADGGTGWGEAFCNWPGFGALHRRRILGELLWPALEGRAFSSPPALFDHLTRTFRPMAVQSGEAGPFDQAISAVDIAAWDLVARRAGLPLHALLAGTDDGHAPRAYASALTGETLDRLVPPLADAGWTGFKVKVGFRPQEDEASLTRLRALAGEGATLMADANQRWSLADAAAAGRRLAGHGLAWLEEPIAADAPVREWRELAAAQPVPLAAGENVRGEAAFEEIVSSGALRFVQPDPIKWGGITRMAAVAAAARGAGVAFCPHYLGCGVGLVATAHVAVAARAPWLEMDVTANPLRDALAGDALRVEAGRVHLAERPGLGVDPDPARDLEPWAMPLA